MRYQIVVCTHVPTGQIIGDRIAVADSILKRLLGLLPKKVLVEGEGLWIMPCKQIHSIGMQFPFDAVFLDSENCIAHLLEAMPAMKVSSYISNAKTVLELPAGTIQRYSLRLGDRLNFQ